MRNGMDVQNVRVVRDVSKRCHRDTRAKKLSRFVQSAPKASWATC